MSDADRCKVDTVRDRYGIESPADEFDDLGGYLVARWRGDHGFESAGYKQLTEWFNKRLLATVYDRHDRSTLATSLDGEYAALVGDDDALRREVSDDLAAAGIDAERVRADFVSWSTMRRHLNGCLDAEKPSPPATTDWELETIRIAAEQARSKAREALGSLGRKGQLAGGDDVDVAVDVELSCPECSTRRSLPDALERGYVCEEHFTPAEEPVDEGRVSRVLRSLSPVAPVGLLAVADELALLGDAHAGDLLSTLLFDVAVALGF